MNENIEQKCIQNILLQNRKNLEITGVEDVISFDEKQILASTELGFLIIKGTNLHIIKFNTTTGELNIDGTINELIYSEQKKHNATNIFGRIFK